MRPVVEAVFVTPCDDGDAFVGGMMLGGDAAGKVFKLVMMTVN